MYSLAKRYFIYILGLFIMTIGIGISVKCNLGVSPVSTIPYTLTLIFGIEMGRATILFYIVLVLIQLAILRRDFKITHVLQILIAIIFGYFTTFSNSIFALFPAIDNYFLRFLMLIISLFCVAIGILLYLSTNLIPLAGEGVMQAVSLKTGLPFPKCKIGFDITMVIISAIACLFFLKNLGSVGIGTILASVLVGVILSVLSKHFKERLLNFLDADNTDDLSLTIGND